MRAGARGAWIAALAGALLLVGASAATASGTFTWGGGAPSDSGWSQADNWVGSAPAASDAGDSLVFPGLLTGGNCSSTLLNVCYTSSDDFSGYGITGLSIDDGVGYDISGSDQLSLGSGGITATTSSTTYDPSVLALPVTLAAPQTWSIDGGSSDQGEVDMTGGVTADSNTIKLDLSNAGFMGFGYGGNDNTLAAINAVGADSTQMGTNAVNNGAVVLYSGNLDNANPDTSVLHLTDAALLGGGTVGTVDTSGALIAPEYDGSIGMDGGATLDPATVVQFPIGTSNGALTWGGIYSNHDDTINLNGATLDLAAAGGSCPSLPLGGSATLVATKVTGTFAGVPNGALVPIDCGSGSGPSVEIEYGSNYVVALVPAQVTLAGPTSLSPNEGVTLRAVVNNGDSLGDVVDFESNGTTIPGCGAVSTNETTTGYSTAAAYCNTSFPAGTDSIQAVFAGVPGVYAGGSSPVLTITAGTAAGSPVTPSLALPTPAVSVVGHTTVTGLSGAGRSAHASVDCEPALASQSCVARLSATSEERFRSGVPVGVAATSARGKLKTRTVSIGSVSADIGYDDRAVCTLALNATGRAFLKRFGRLPATLFVNVASSNGTALVSISETVTFSAAAKHHQRG